ncbi:MAG: hypothetical protein ACRDZP_01525, partial [Acidimicrobiales bacterium]
MSRSEMRRGRGRLAPRHSRNKAAGIPLRDRIQGVVHRLSSRQRLAAATSVAAVVVIAAGSIALALSSPGSPRPTASN